MVHNRPRILRLAVTALALMALAACATQAPGTVVEGDEIPGFFSGIWHGMIFPVAWFFSLFAEPGELSVYAVPNTGGGYNFGFFIGISLLGGGTLSWLEDKPNG